MPAPPKKMVVLVHGWSVHNTDTYGGLPQRLEAEARNEDGLNLEVRQIWLSKYVSFRDEIRLEDVSRALEAAVQRDLGALIDEGRRFICITHSTGGPVVRDWWDRYYVKKNRARACPMSHLIMLAPANFGSALAQLGKSRVGRLKSWFEDVEPGQGILDWLELGSDEAWELNKSWFDYPDTTTGARNVFPFVLTGQQIDREFYDNVNSYTGEIGSDGVVRVAAANLNATFVSLEQQQPKLVKDGDRPTYEAPALRIKETKSSRRTAFALIRGRSHSGKDMGIMRSIGASTRRSHPTVDAILQCIRVETPADYRALCERFDQITADVQREELLELDTRFLLPDRYFIHDPYSMVIFRLRDDQGHVVDAFDLLLLAGRENDPNLLPKGFFGDRQRNSHAKGTLSYFLNHEVMTGGPAVTDKDGKVYREQQNGVSRLGFRISPHMNDENLVHYFQAELAATSARLAAFLQPNQTTMVDITLRRIVRERVFRLTKDRRAQDFRKDKAGPLVP